VHNGKQTFDCNSSPENWRLIEEALNSTLHYYFPILEAASACSVLSQLTGPYCFVLGGACCAVYNERGTLPGCSTSSTTNRRRALGC
jgi:hypothetical protein